MGTEMLKAKAQLLSMLTLKNMRDRRARRLSGILGRARPKTPFCLTEEEERDRSWEGRAKRAVRRNWMSVMRRPGLLVSRCSLCASIRKVATCVGLISVSVSALSIASRE